MGLIEQRELFEGISTQLGRTMAKFIKQSLDSPCPEETTYNIDDIAADMAEILYNEGWRKRRV